VLDLEAGGLERVVADLARWLDPARFDVHVLALRFLGRHAEGLEKYATLHVSPPLPPWTMIWPGPLRAAIKSIAPDVVHTHSGAWYKTAIAARGAGVRAIVHTEHGRPTHDPWHGRAIEYLASRRTNTLIAVSPNLKARMQSSVASGCSVEVILNGVDTDAFVPDRSATGWRERLGLTATTPVIGCVARLDPIKDFPMLLEALAILRKNWPNSERPVLVLAGDGPERDHIAELTARWELDGAVHCVGWVGPTLDLYPLFDVFTLSSRSEGTSIALLEAMSCGVCPVVTAVGGNVAVMGPQLADLLVPSQAPEILGDRWRSVLLDASARRAYAAIARQRVVEQYSLSAMVRNHEALYTRLAS
jgi:glycosyltransferase involved in cell wall biosynthesis